MKVHYGWLTGQQRSHIKPSKKTWPIGQPGAKPPLQIPFVTKNGGHILYVIHLIWLTTWWKVEYSAYLYTWYPYQGLLKNQEIILEDFADPQLELDPNLTRTRPYLEPEQNPNSTQQKRRYIFLLLFHVMLWLLPPLRFMRQAKLLPLYDVPPPSLSSMAYLEQDNFDR